jgi:hypothetical protein
MKQRVDNHNNDNHNGIEAAGSSSDIWGFNGGGIFNDHHNDMFGGIPQEEEDFRDICEFDCDRCENTTFRIVVCNIGTETIAGIVVEDEDLEFSTTITLMPGECRTFNISRFIGQDEVNEVVVTSPSQADIPGCVVRADAEIRINREKKSEKGFEPIFGVPDGNKNSGDASGGLFGHGPLGAAPWQRRSGMLFPRFP